MPQIIDIPGHGQVEFPDGMSDQDITGAIQKNLSPPKASLADKMVGGWGGRMLMGAASPVLAATQLLGGEGGRKAVADLDAMKQRGMAADGKDGFDWYGLLGSLAPGAGIAKGVSAVLPTATSLMGKMGVGAAQGAVAAAAQPARGMTADEYFPEKAAQVGLGGVLGGAIPAVGAGIGKVGSTVKQAAQPFYEKGRAAILKQFQESMMQNDPALKAKFVQAASQAKPGMGGVMPTLGETLAGLPDEQLAARSTGLAAHQKDIAKIGGVSPDFAAQQAAQEAAHRAGIGTVAKTPSALEQALQTRAAAAKQNYGTAFKDTVTPDSAFKDLVSRPSMDSVLKRAKDLAKENGDVFKIGKDLEERVVTSPIVSASGQTIQHTLPAEVAKYPVKSLHYVKMAMDDLLKNPERFGIGASEARAIGGTQKEFVKWLGGTAPDFAGKSPAYGMARETHRALSGPVNEMQIGQKLQDILTSPLGTSERRSAFASAMMKEPQTIKSATGRQIFDSFDEALQPKNKAIADQILDELAKRDAYEKLAGKTSIGGKDAIPGDIGLPLPNLLWRPSMVANFMMKHFAKGAEDKMAKVAGQQYLDPRLFAESMKDVPARYQPMLDALMQQGPAAAGTTTGRQF